MAKFGLATDNLLSARVVTADGRTLTASEQENADLFWGLRGGGGNFGVVSSFEYRLHEVGPTVTGGLVAHPFDAAGDVLRFFRDFTADAPDELLTSPASGTRPTARAPRSPSRSPAMSARPSRRRRICGRSGSSAPRSWSSSGRCPTRR